MIVNKQDVIEYGRKMFEEIFEKIKALPKDDPRLPIIKNLVTESTLNKENLSEVMKLLEYKVNYQSGVYEES